MTDMTPEQALDELRIYFDSLADAPEATPESVREWGLSMLQALSRPAVPEGFRLVPEGFVTLVQRASETGHPITMNTLVGTAIDMLSAAPSAQAEKKQRGWVVPAQQALANLDRLATYVRDAVDNQLSDHVEIRVCPAGTIDLDGEGQNNSLALAVFHADAVEEGCLHVSLNDEEQASHPTFQSPSEFAAWLETVTDDPDNEVPWPPAVIAASAVRAADLCPSCGSDIIYEDRIDQAKGVRHCDDCGEEIPKQASQPESDQQLGCDYHGYDFGARYPDAQCIDGYLWDEDSCDEPGGPLTLGGDIPCPKCNAEEYREYFAAQSAEGDSE